MQKKTKIDELLQTGAGRHQRAWQSAEKNPPAKEARSWRIEGQKGRLTRKEYKRLLKKFEMEGFMAQKGLWNLVGKKVLQDRGALPEEEGDVIREYKAMHVKNVMTRGKDVSRTLVFNPVFSMRVSLPVFIHAQCGMVTRQPFGRRAKSPSVKSFHSHPHIIMLSCVFWVARALH